MKKGEAYEIFDGGKLDLYYCRVEFGKVPISEVPDYYKAAVMLVRRYQRVWWKHLHLDAVGKCIIRKEFGRTKNMGIIRKIDLDTNTVYVYNKKLPEGLQNYVMGYDVLESNLNWGPCHVRLILAYDNE